VEISLKGPSSLSVPKTGEISLIWLILRMIQIGGMAMISRGLALLSKGIPPTLSRSSHNFQLNKTPSENEGFPKLEI
jgi:hypothetical protein